MNERAVIAILKYEDDCLFMPKNNWPKYIAKKRVYERTAVEYAVQRIMKTSTKPAKETLLELYQWADKELDHDHTVEGEMMLRTARDVFEDLIYQIV